MYEMCPSCLACATKTTTKINSKYHFRLCHSLCTPKLAIIIQQAAMLQIFLKKYWTLFKRHSHLIVKVLQWPTLLLYQLIDAASVIDNIDDNNQIIDSTSSNARDLNDMFMK